MNKKYIINDFSLENIRSRQEARVIGILKKVLPERTDFCGCRICIEDTYALTLNSLHPQYAQVGSLIIRHAPPTDDEVGHLVNMAIDKVQANPNHPLGSSKDRA
ncbi:MAG: late competence development ComFB family protein [Deltaproteobacteria bacterium]|nr:late competence development ComFB family protein [Deltaproteobacteria bacterium]